MPTIMQPAPRADLLKRVENEVHVEVDLNFLESAGRLLRLAYHRAGLTQQEAMHALGVRDPGQFNKMLAGTEKLWLHQLLRPSARPIWKQLIVVSAQDTPGMVVRVRVDMPDATVEMVDDFDVIDSDVMKGKGR